MTGKALRTDVLVVGGGLTGCAAAYYLAREGKDVLLIEQHEINTLASGSNAGSLHGQIPHDEFIELGDAWAVRFAEVLPLMVASMGLWSELEAELEADLEVSLSGGLIVADTDGQMRDIERKAAIERAHGVELELLTRSDLFAIAPYVSERMIGGAFFPMEGKANPLLATPAFARAAERHGARIHRHTTLEALSLEANGFTAITNAGPIVAGQVINCAGAKAGDIAAMVGLDLPIEGFPIQVNVTEPTAHLVAHLVYFAGGRLTLKQTARGAFLIGGGWPAAFDPVSGRLQVDPGSVQRNLHVAVATVPRLADVNLLRTWPAIVNGTADWRPILGEAPRARGFFMCMFPWMGFTAGPICARVVADLACRRQPSIDVSPFGLAV
ncbi:MAG: NAD(P)/FAD-dependent oxidoreductase [Hyphomicrobiales bacterium]